MKKSSRIVNSQSQATKRSRSDVPMEIQNEARSMIANGLSEAILGFNPGGVESQLSQTDTLFANNRWYLVSNMRQLLNEIYAEQGPIQTAVDIPVDDGMRGGVNFKTKQLNEKQITELQVYFEQENILEEVVGQGVKWNRLFGGAAIIPVTDQNPAQPFMIEKIKKDTKLGFRAVDMWELFGDQNTADDLQSLSPLELKGQGPLDCYRFYNVPLHRSRVMKMKGIIAPSMIRTRLRGWGLSITETMVRSISQYLKSGNVIFEILDEAKIDVYKIKGLNASMMNADGQGKVQARIRLANQQKNIQNAITLDSLDDYVQKQISFGGLAEIVKELRIQIASDIRIPMTKLFGMSASGFNSGEDDIENYNAMVESQVRNKCKHHIIKIAMIICQKLFGVVPEDLQVEFKPLRVLGAKDEEEVKDKQYNRLMAAYDKGLASAQEFKEGCNKANLLPIQLDPTVEALPTAEQLAADDAAQEQAEGDTPIEMEGGNQG